MFARADTQKIQGLLDETVGDCGILTEAASQGAFTRAQFARFLADQQTRRQP
jgi:hypothetical protein